MWTEWSVRWDFVTPLHGTLPMDEKLWEDWFKKHIEDRVTPPAHKTAQEMQEQVFEAIVEAGEAIRAEEKRGLVGFPKMSDSLVAGGYTVRSHFKDCARVLSRFIIGRVKGEVNFGSKIVNCLYVKDEWIPILNNLGVPVSEPSGMDVKPITVIVPSTGQRVTTIKRVFYVFPARMEFTLLALPSVKVGDLTKIMEYGAVHGYGGDRSVGFGKYLFTMKGGTNESNPPA